jgi:type I restriction enzyme S subunit
MKPPPIDIRPDQWAIVRDILQRHVPQYEVWAFGSRATWNAKEYSDLDLAVITDKPLSLVVSAALSGDFSESDLPWKVDVIDWATTSETFRKIIERDKVVVQSAKEERLVVGEWRSLPLSSLLAEGRAISYGIVQPGTHQDVGVPIVRVTDIRGGRISVDKPLRVAREIEARYARTRLRGGELLLTLVGTVGESAVVPPEMEGWNVARAVAVIPVREDIGADWVKIALNAPEAREMIFGRLNTTVQATLNLKDVAQLPILLPEEDERERISNILGTLDDKIDVNRRMNETLEATARAIFQSWFVDFDPVRAKASGEAPESICRRLGLTPDLLALFPHRLVDSELGEIPERWEVQSLEPLTNYLNRGLSPKYVEHGGVLVLNQKCIRDGRINSSKARRHDPAQRKIDCRLIEIGDILENSTGVGTLGRVAQVLGLDEPTIVDSHITVVRADTDKVSWNYLGVAVLERQSEIEALGEGSTGQTELSRARLGALEFLMPPRQLREHFDSIVSGFRLHAKHNDVQSHTLAQIRDALLPKLLSGELRVPDAEAITDDAAA